LMTTTMLSLTWSLLAPPPCLYEICSRSSSLQNNASSLNTAPMVPSTTAQHTPPHTPARRLRPLALHKEDLARHRPSPRHRPRQLHLPPHPSLIMVVIVLSISCAGFHATWRRSASSASTTTSRELGMMEATPSVRLT
jgi:hypothetical protein